MAPSVRSVDVAGPSLVTSATKNANTIAELTSTLPQTWRPALSALLLSVYRVASKLCTVQNTIVQYERHVAEGSFPASIVNSLKEPKLQFSKEFMGTEVGALATGTLNGAVHSARKELLRCALDRKKEELAALQALTVYDAKAWRKAIAEVATRVATTLGGSVQGDSSSSIAPTWSGSMPKAIIDDCKALWEHGSVFHYRAVGLARSIADRSLVEKTRLMSLKKDADVKMRDADTELSTRDVVRDEMQAQIRLLKTELVKTMSESPGKRRDPPLTLYRPQKKVRPSKEEGRLEPFSRQEGSPEEEGRKERTKVMTVSSFLKECSKDFRPWLAETYPLVYLRLSSMTHLKIGFALSRLWEVSTLRANKPSVFKQTGVDLPEDIEYMLAVNHKFIFHQNPTKHDVEEAKTRLTRTVRNQWFFRGKQQNDDFVPRFHVKNTKWNPPRASRPIEQGLEDAMAVIESQVSLALSTIASRPAVRKFSNWTRVQEYINSRELLVKLTDKNLGLAVFTKTWYDTQVLKMLTDTSVYVPVFEVPAESLRKRLWELLPSWDLPNQMDKYIRAKTDIQVPEFHGIPKVHKEPWALRPIVPSHSWVTTTCSEVLDHLCRPLLDLFPWVVDSTKEVIGQIEKVVVTDDKPVWIITGDVTACYTNIPPKACANVMSGFWKTYRHDSSIKRSTIKAMVKFIMENSFLSYRGQPFRQVQGLAMGTACAPCLANLYMAYYEMKAKVVHQDGVLLYVRYIDDILCLFQGTREEVTDFMTRYSLGPLNVTWSVSGKRNEFLDIELIREAQLGLRAVHTRLFRKPLNRHLYIPWSSAHPLHVKKGFVKAELIRLAMICSRLEYFTDARQEFYGNLRRRGYPAETLREWFTVVQYRDRPLFLFRKEKKEFAPLMLPGHYNPVWDYIDVKQVISAARRSWVTVEELPPSLEEPLIRSLGKTMSLFDLMSSWNKTTLLSPSSLGQ